jgi:hypothetical protein
MALLAAAIYPPTAMASYDRDLPPRRLTHSMGRQTLAAPKPISRPAQEAGPPSASDPWRLQMPPHYLRVRGRGPVGATHMRLRADRGVG